MKKIVLNLVGKTTNELMGNLNSLVNQACKAKNDHKEWPSMVSATDEGEIRIVDEDKEVQARMKKYEKLMKEAAFFLQFADSKEAREHGDRMMGAMRH
jgi:hypothetical protein